MLSTSAQTYHLIRGAQRPDSFVPGSYSNEAGPSGIKVEPESCRHHACRETPEQKASDKAERSAPGQVKSEDLSELVRSRFFLGSPKIDPYGHKQLLIDARFQKRANSASKNTEASHAQLATMVRHHIRARPNLAKHLVDAVWTHVDRMMGRVTRNEVEDLHFFRDIEERLETVRQVGHGILLMPDPSRLYRKVWRNHFTPSELSDLVAIVTLRYMGGHWEETASQLINQGGTVKRYLDVVESQIMGGMIEE